MTIVAAIAAPFVAGATRLVTGVTANWIGCPPSTEQRIYFANHTSHGDFLLIWTALPPRLRATTRPVAGSDYWCSGRVRRFVGQDVFNAVLVDRAPPKTATGRWDPLSPIRDALASGVSLIIFPEGTRNMTDAPLLPFKSGIYYLAAAFPKVPLVPTWIENVGRVLPKGEVLPVPLLCSIRFGTPLLLGETEHKGHFLTRSEQSLRSLADVNAHDAAQEIAA